MGIEMLVYCPPMEEGADKVTGWEKETIEYVTKHRSKIYSQIRGIAKNIRKHKLQSTDVDDIYSEVMLYLHDNDDYNISKAIERASTNNIISLEGYINICIKFCVVRYCTELYKEEKDKISDTTSDDDGKELSLFDTIADDKSMNHTDSVIYDLEALCKSCESLRYRYGPDIYLVWYVRLLTLKDNNNELYKDILSVLGISKRELMSVERQVDEDEVMGSFAKAINIIGLNRAIEIIRPYVYSAKKIEETVLAYS